MSKDFELTHHLQDDELSAYRQLVSRLKNTPVPDNEVLANLGLYLTRSSMARIMYFNEIYRNIVNQHGVIIEFGVRWGQSLAILMALRANFEPFNISRKIIGFDTFSGLTKPAKEDGESLKTAEGSYDVCTDYLSELTSLLQIHESLNPKANVQKFELIEGDVTNTLLSYLKEHPETIVSFAYFDMDLYEPTKSSLENILPYCHEGTILGFDELCYPDFPGETIAMREVLKDVQYSILRLPYSPQQSYIRINAT